MKPCKNTMDGLLRERSQLFSNSSPIGMSFGMPSHPMMMVNQNNTEMTRWVSFVENLSLCYQRFTPSWTLMALTIQLKSEQDIFTLGSSILILKYKYIVFFIFGILFLSVSPSLETRTEKTQTTCFTTPRTNQQTFYPVLLNLSKVLMLVSQFQPNNSWMRVLKFSQSLITLVSSWLVPSYQIIFS